MGWCSGTEIFDTVCEAVVDHPKLSEAEQVKIVERVANAMEAMDWDCQGDSQYYDHIVVRKAKPEWYSDED